MRGLQGRDKVIPVAMIILIGLAVLVTKAEAVTIERSAEIAKTISGNPTYRWITAEPGSTVDAARRGTVVNTRQGRPISRRLLATAWAAAVPHAPGSHSGLLIPNDPFALLTTEKDNRATDAFAPMQYDARVRENLPIVVSASTVLVTSLLGWRLIAPPRPQHRKNKRSPKSSPSAWRGEHETTTASDVIHYISESFTPRFLKRRKRSRRKVSPL